jgi:hypothetical protein
LHSYENDEAPAKEAPAPEPKVEAPPAVVKSDVMVEEEQHNGGADEQMYSGGGGDDDDDEVDFNLGSGGSNEPNSHYQESQGPGIKEDG